MRTSGGRGSTRAERENVASATARRASHVVASYPLSPTKFEKPAQRAGFFVFVVLTDMQHRFREIQPYCTPLPGAAQSALPGLRVQRCLRAGSPDRCASIASGKCCRTAHSSRGRCKAPCPGYGFSVVCGPCSPDRCASIASGKCCRTAHRSRGRRKAPCPGYGFSVVCGPVARTDAPASPPGKYAAC